MTLVRVRLYCSPPTAGTLLCALDPDIRIDDNEQHWGTGKTFRNRIYDTALWWLNVELLESVVRLCYVGTFLERWFPEMWALDGNYRIAVVGFCFLVGFIINLNWLWELYAWLTGSIWIFHILAWYWWACWWSSGTCDGNKWRLALIVRWAVWRSGPGLWVHYRDRSKIGCWRKSYIEGVVRLSFSSGFMIRFCGNDYFVSWIFAVMIFIYSNLFDSFVLGEFWRERIAIFVIYCGL